MLGFWGGVFVGAFLACSIGSACYFASSNSEDRCRAILIAEWMVVGSFLLLYFGLLVASEGGRIQYVPNTPTPLLGR